MDDPQRTEAPDNDLDLTFAGQADPIDALQVEPQDAEEPAPADLELSEADTPFEMVEDEHTPMKLIGDPIAAILRSDEGSALDYIDQGVAVTPEAKTEFPPTASELPRTVGILPTAIHAIEERGQDAHTTKSIAAAPVEEVVDDPVESTEPIDQQEPELVAAGGRTGAWWTLPLIFAGIGVVACALLVPAADENRRAMHALAKINRDVAYFERQSEVNKEFLSRVSSDPNLAERLAMRQLRMTRPDAKIAPLPAHHDKYGMSPFALVTIDPPAAVPEYRPMGGFLGRWFLDPQKQMYFCGAGLLMIATGLICGGGSRTVRPTHDAPV